MSFYYNYVQEGKKDLVTDLNTYGLMCHVLGKKGIDPLSINYKKIDNQTYAFFVGTNTTNVNYDLILFNKGNSEYPISVGWKFFKPLEINEHKISNNINLIKIYDQKFYVLQK